MGWKRKTEVTMKIPPGKTFGPLKLLCYKAHDKQMLVTREAALVRGSAGFRLASASPPKASARADKQRNCPSSHRPEAALYAQDPSHPLLCISDQNYCRTLFTLSSQLWR